MNKWTLWESVSNSCKESGGCRTRSARSDHGRSARSCWKLKFWKTRSQRSQPWRRASRRTSRPPACPPHASLKLCSLLWPLTAVCVSWMDHRGENNLWDHQNKLWRSAEYLHLKSSALASAPLLLSVFFLCFALTVWIQLVTARGRARRGQAETYFKYDSVEVFSI